ncbi:MAG TPA: GNAT family N-acetyltransferase [Panacibacter sp.]|nr:GNAT family N-acetyltransferase [Panacibacter sp.]HNP47067.1 GNAT family N-acetyltransferase [Panacibacter sp.]
MQNDTFPVLATQRLILRQLTAEDDQQIFALRSDNAINKYLNRQKANTIDDARNFINQVVNNHSLYWAIHLTDQNMLVGTVCLFNFSADQCQCEIGYELLTSFQGSGIMREAVQQVVDYAFHTTKVKRIEASAHRDNERSVNLLEKLLFKRFTEPGSPDPASVYFYLSS